MKRILISRAIVIAATLLIVPASRADFSLIINGTFEDTASTSGLTNWTVANQAGSEGNWFSQTGTASPVNLIAVPAPPGGTRAAMTDAGAAGSHVMYQDFVVPNEGAIGTATLRFDAYINNQGGLFANPASLDFASTFLNQQIRVDLIDPTADPFTTATASVFASALATPPGTPLLSGYSTVFFDVRPLLNARLGQTIRLRFAEVDNVLMLNFGVDNIAITGAVIPEPSSFVLLGLGVVGLATARFARKRREATA